VYKKETMESIECPKMSLSHGNVTFNVNMSPNVAN